MIVAAGAVQYSCPMLLRGERVVLREARTSDRAELERLRADPEIDRYMGTDTPPAGSILNRVFVGSSSGALADYVLQGPTGRIIGLLSFWERAVPHHAAEVSIWLARDYRGHGYGTDALLLGLRHIFKRFRLHKIYLRVLWYNTAAIRCYERCGFRKEGVLREEMCVEGVWHDLIYMGVLRSEFHVPSPDGADGRR